LHDFVNESDESNDGSSSTFETVHDVDHELIATEKDPLDANNSNSDVNPEEVPSDKDSVISEANAKGCCGGKPNTRIKCSIS
jgi:hypothetical protein